MLRFIERLPDSSPSSGHPDVAHVQRWTGHFEHSRDLLWVSCAYGTDEVVCRRLERKAYLSTVLEHASFPTLRYHSLGEQKTVLAYEWVNAIPLDQWLCDLNQSPTSAQARKFGMQLIEAVSVLHKTGFAHGELCPENILIDDRKEQLFVVGLGGSRSIGQVEPGVVYAGRYDAPERRHADVEVSSAADVYACGILLGDLLGPHFLELPLGKSMTDADPRRRPISTEIAKWRQPCEPQPLSTSLPQTRFAA